jgi:hypothetical protein
MLGMNFFNGMIAKGTCDFDPFMRGMRNMWTKGHAKYHIGRKIIIHCGNYE